jgi:multiple antibiotic resistance protein
VDLWKDLITLLAVVDPIGTIPIYLTATMGMTVAAQRKVAVRATLIAAGVLTAFIVAGQIVLNAMGISLSAYQVAGGIVLFLFALQMVFDPGSHSQEADQSKGHDVAVFPIAIPSIAGPAAMMAVVILTDNSRSTSWSRRRPPWNCMQCSPSRWSDACRDPHPAIDR